MSEDVAVSTWVDGGAIKKKKNERWEKEKETKD